MNRQDFWSEVFKLHGSVTPFIMARVCVFTLFAVLVWIVEEYTHFQTGIGVAPYEIIGVVLALLLVLRTNAGYDRWYEGRKLWGGIVNQSRNLSTIGCIYGPQEQAWQESFARWSAAFSHSCRHSLRGEKNLEDMVPLLGREETENVEKSQHHPMYVAGRIAELLRSALQQGKLDRFAFLQAEQERTDLIDHIGACERIAATPLAQVFSIKIRRFLFLYLMVLPIALADKTGALTPVIVALVAYPLLSLDQIGIELQSPFLQNRLSHLPLDRISTNIENNILSFLSQSNTSLTAEISPSLPFPSNGKSEVMAVANGLK